MKTRIVFATLMVFISFAFSVEENGKLKITLTNIKKSGKIRAAVYRREDEFPGDKTIFKYLATEASNGKCELDFESIPFGSYAVAVYQDVNGNGKLDKGMFGIPEEPFAFSNNFRPRFGGPSFDKCKFDFKENNQMLTIEMINSLLGGD
jgi:uncharacterized protein (DUF2141 family)